MSIAKRLQLGSIGFVVVRVKPHSIDLLIPIFRHCQWLFSAVTKVWLMIPILSLHCRCDNYYQCQVRKDSNNDGIMGWGYQGTKMQAHHGVNPAALHGHRSLLQECTAGKKDASVV